MPGNKIFAVKGVIITARWYEVYECQCGVSASAIGVERDGLFEMRHGVGIVRPVEIEVERLSPFKGITCVFGFAKIVQESQDNSFRIDLC